ncbi:MAG: YciI family protein [Gammaproteobacteria bacterium]|nr:YciI family protein [Gammaproteobacteria bacterium]
MWYAIIAHDVSDSLSKRQSARAAHLERLQALQDAGRLLIAGPHPAIDAIDSGTAGFTGSLIVAEFASLQAAEQWAQTDPYMMTGVYSHVDIKPFKRVF